jgi:hypothetical protein
LWLSFPCSEKPLTTSVLWKNFDQKVVSAGKWRVVAGKLFCGFDVHFASFSVWNLAFLRNVWAFHFCSMWILTTTAFHSPKVHFHGGNADVFPQCAAKNEWNFSKVSKTNHSSHQRWKKWLLCSMYYYTFLKM